MEELAQGHAMGNLAQRLPMEEVLAIAQAESSNARGSTDGKFGTKTSNGRILMQ